MSRVFPEAARTEHRSWDGPEDPAPSAHGLVRLARRGRDAIGIGRLRASIGRVRAWLASGGTLALAWERSATTPQTMTETPRRGTCARCGLTFDADRGYTVLDVLERAAENPRENSTEKTIRLCDVCAEDFRDFLDLGRTAEAETDADLTLDLSGSP